MTFEEAFKRVIGFEGDYSNDPRDPGGETHWGISKRAYPDLDIKNLSLNSAKALYLKDYWDPLNLNQLPENIRYAMFDMAVNMGLQTAAKLLQRALTVVDDGVIGPNTLKAANASTNLPARLAVARLLYYTDLKPFDSFGRGWTRRAAQVLLESL